MEEKTTTIEEIKKILQKSENINIILNIEEAEDE